MKTLSTWLMVAFISGVIVAGFFGPYMISVILSLLTVLCIAAMMRPRRPSPPDGHKPVV